MIKKTKGKRTRGGQQRIRIRKKHKAEKEKYYENNNDVTITNTTRKKKINEENTSKKEKEKKGEINYKVRTIAPPPRGCSRGRSEEQQQLPRGVPVNTNNKLAGSARGRGDRRLHTKLACLGASGRVSSLVIAAGADSLMLETPGRAACPRRGLMLPPECFVWVCVLFGVCW